MKISKDKLQTLIGMYLFLIFAFTVDFRISIFKNVFIAYIFAFVAISLLYKGTHTHLSKNVPILLMLWGGSIIWVISSFNISYIIKYLIGLILLYCFYRKGGAKYYTVTGLALCGVIFSVATFGFYFIPNIYIDYVVPKLAGYLQSTAIIMIQSNRYPGLTGHYSTNGIYLAIGFGATISLCLTKMRIKEKKWTIILSILLIIGALLLIGKRAHLVFSIAGAFIVYWIYNSQYKKSRLMKLFGLFIVGSILFVIAVNQIPALGNTFNRFSETAESGDFLMSRGKFYLIAFEQFKKNPILGCGWKTMVNILEHDVHNVYIQLLAETGVVGFTFFVILFLNGVVLSIRLLKAEAYGRLQLDKGGLSLLYFAAYYIFFFVLYAFTGNPLYDEQPFYMLMIAYGILLYIKYGKGGLKE